MFRGSWAAATLSTFEDRPSVGTVATSTARARTITSMPEYSAFLGEGI